MTHGHTDAPHAADSGPVGRRVVAITGASAGIGRATALRLARDGAALVVCARRSDKLAELAREVERAGGVALDVAADVTDAGAMTDLVRRAVERFGRLDAMICNAGFGIYGAIDTIEPERMRRLLDVNYMGTYHAMRAALPIFREQRHGHLFVISSIVGQRGIPFMGAYAATKFAQVGLAECVRAELQGTGIYVSTVFPISTESEFFQVMSAESGFATRASGPRQRADDVADAIARALDRPRPEIYPYRPAKGLAIINAIAPAWCDRLVRRWGREPATPAPH
jgi:short-subunit dehydrogenase